MGLKLINETELAESIIWHSSFYDGPLAGLCRINGELHSFDYFGDEDGDRRFSVNALTLPKKVRWLSKKWIFEICVGTHCSYTAGRRANYFYVKRPRWLWTLIFNLYYGRSPFRALP